MKEKKVKEINKKIYKSVAISLIVTTLMGVISYFIFHSEVFKDLPIVYYLWILPFMWKIYWDHKRKKHDIELLKELKKENNI